MDGFYSHCPKCGAIESVYKKKVINGSVNLLPSKFYVCPNPACIFYLKLDSELHNFSVVEKEKFQWIKIFEYQKKEQVDNIIAAH